MQPSSTNKKNRRKRKKLNHDDCGVVVVVHDNNDDDDDDDDPDHDYDDIDDDMANQVRAGHFTGPATGNIVASSHTAFLEARRRVAPSRTKKKGLSKSG